ncbi:hypothetical protein ACFVWL_18965 [Microbacterium sp. NPDC058269]|uniref:hypothetical protein n=1 Tax=Microbacterium sp. NPDC058269 TaxID=3346414 RepID=UPI0036D936C2
MDVSTTLEELDLPTLKGLFRAESAWAEPRDDSDLKQLQRSLRSSEQSDEKISAVKGSLTVYGSLPLDYLIETPDVIVSDYVHVFLHGMVNRREYRPPMFYRRSSSRRTRGVCLFLSDPVFHVSEDAGVGWYLSAYSKLRPAIETLIAEICARHGLNGIVWHGTSSGGYAAIRMALDSSMPSVALAAAPHNDPRDAPHWHMYEEIKSIANGTDPVPLSDLLETTVNARSGVVTLINDRDWHHLYAHLPHIMIAKGVTSRRHYLARSGLGHFGYRESDYWEAYEAAIAMLSDLLKRKAGA